VPWNEPVKITGSIQRVQVKDKLLPHLFVGLGSDDSTTKPIEHIDEIESVEITEEDKKKIQEFVIRNKDRVLDALAELYAQSHIGDKDAKKGVLMCAANSGMDSHKRRINVLFLGETGLDKTPLAKAATRTVPGSKFASATDSTTNSLICVVEPDTEHFRFGPIVTANGAICIVDEIGRMPKEEQGRILSAMQEGTIQFGRYGLTRPLEASASFVLTANPDSTLGKFRDEEKIDPTEFPFLGPFRDRIDLILIFRANRDPSYLRDYGSSKFENEDNRIALLKKEGNNYQYLKKHILYSKRFVDFKFSSEAECMITEYFTDAMIPKGSQTSNRLLDTLRKCCYAVARLKLKDTIEAEDAREVIEFYNKQLGYWSQVKADIPSDPRDLAYQEIVKKLTGQKFAIEFEQLLQAVCKDNIYVDRYTMKFDEEDNRVWDIENNKHVRYIRDKFTKEPRDERILTLGTSPLTLAWSETYQGGDKNKAAAIDDDNGSEGTKSVTAHSDQTDQTDCGKRYSDEENGPRTDQLTSSVENSNGQNGQLGNRDLGGSKSTNEPPEDYEKKEVVVDNYDESDASDIDGRRNEEIPNDPSNANTDVKPETKTEISNEGIIPEVTSANCLSDASDASDISGKRNEEFSDDSNTNTKPEISNEGVIPDINPINPITLPTDQSKAESSQPSQLPSEPSTPPEVQEDYEMYVNRQKKTFDAIEADKKVASDIFSSEQESTFRQIFAGLADEDAERHLVPEEKLKDALVSSGKLSQSDMVAIIMNMEMVEDGIEEVSWLIGGVPYPTYRMKSDNS
jgi:MCM P-loop domain